MRERTLVFLVSAMALLACGETRPAPSAGDDGTSEKEAAAVKEVAKKPVPVKDVFPPQVAGSFYPADPAELQKTVEGYLKDAGKDKTLGDRDVVGILAPHAGYRYSGPIAGKAYATVASRPYKLVVIAALNHRRRAPRIALLDKPAYKTPLGDAPIAQEVVRRLVEKSGEVFSASANMFRSEHSLEVQIPFIQVVLPQAEILPIIVAVEDEDLIRKAGEILFEELAGRPDVLFVVSSDLSHHFPYTEAREYDQGNLELLEQWRIEEWKTSAARTRKGMCGHRPMLMFAKMFEGFEEKKRRVTRLDYRNSGDTSGDKSSVVGYGALAFSVEKNMRQETGELRDFGPFTVEIRRELMALAKASVAAAAKGERMTPPETTHDILEEKGAAFVTLKRDGHLRGCIGHVIARVPLMDCVSDVARSAAIHDHRFSPVTPEELDSLSFEISVLTKPEPIAPKDVVVGVHGLIMTLGSNSGLLLPQVPVEWGWEREEFLAHTCRKAGLPLDCWKNPATEIKSFKAIVWGEEDL